MTPPGSGRSPAGGAAFHRRPGPWGGRGLDGSHLRICCGGTRRAVRDEFHWSSPGLGVVHALGIPFVFDTATPDAPLFGPMLGEDPPQELAQTMHAAWVAFASTGDPGWPGYEPGRRATMRFDAVSRVVEDPRAWERALWTGIR